MREHTRCEEFTGRIESHCVQLIALCRNMLWRPDDLEDALQEVLLRAFSLYPSFDGTDFNRWLNQVAIYTLYNINRKKHMAAAEPSEEQAPVDTVRQLELEETYAGILDDPSAVFDTLDERLLSGLRGLSDVERSVFLLRALCDLKYRDVSEVLNIPLGSVMGNLARARAKLRKHLAEYSHEM